MKYVCASSFKKHTDLMQKAYLNDMEAGKESINLDMRFFEDVENVKEDMSQVERHYRKLQDAINEQSKIVHNAKTMKELRAQMVSDVEQVLKHVKVIKGKLEGLENSNAAHRKLPGCGQGSSADRTRISIINGLGEKLKNMMDIFQGLRNRMTLEYKETVERRYFTITGEEATQENVGNMISSGESESFLQKLNQEQVKGQIMIDAISEIQERHDALKEIEKNLMELHLVFLDMAALLESQGHQLNKIQSHVAQSNLFVRRGSTDDLQVAMEYQMISPVGTCIAIVVPVVALALAILLLPFLTKYVFLHQWP